MRRISGLIALVLSLGCSSAPEPKINLEKTLQSIVLEKAEDYQIVHFGENHDNQKDNKFVISLLPELRNQGFSYFAYGLDSVVQPMIDDYLTGVITFEDFDKKFPYHPKTHLPILEAAHKSGFKVILYDDVPNRKNIHEYKAVLCGLNRAEKQFKNLKREIFDNNPDAKVVVYSGRTHIDERPRYYQQSGIYGEKALGFFLDDFTNGRNLSVSLIEDEFYLYCDPRGYVKPDLALSIE